VPDIARTVHRDRPGSHPDVASVDPHGCGVLPAAFLVPGNWSRTSCRN